MHFLPFDPRHPAHIEAATAVWNQACGADLAISPAGLAFNSRPAMGAVQAGQLAWAGDAAVGLVLASALPADPLTAPPEEGWIDALAVVPAQQRRGVGSALLAWAEGWLAAQGCTAARLGGSLRPFAPGLPVELGSEPFFAARGFGPPGAAQRSQLSAKLASLGEATVWDVATDSCQLFSELPSVGGGTWIAAGRPGDDQALLAFLRREFPGRWRFEFEEFRRLGGKMSEYTLLWRREGTAAAHVDGFCRIRRRWRYAVEPLDRFFMHRLPRPWGQLGPIGVGQAGRGRGAGSALLRFSLARLAAYGVRGCLVDWTTLVDYYGKFGFQPFRAYRVLVKDSLGGG